MRVLNETTARNANKEDDCTRHFWESRFKCQALLDEQAVLSCMTYVDLNPIRAAMATTPEDSDHTSIKRRIQHWKQKAEQPANTDQHSEDFQPNELMRFAGNPRQPMPEGIPFDVLDYLELLDWTGRQIRDDKRGRIDDSTPPVLERLAISPKHWVYLCTHFEIRFKGLVGSAHSLTEKCANFGRKRRSNFSSSKSLFS